MQDWSAEDLDTVLNIRSMNAYLDTHSRSSAREASLNSVHDQNLYRARQRYLFGLRDDIASTPQVEISLNRGLVHRILTDAAYSDRLETMGLHAYNAYECVLSFLFRPSLPIQELLHQYRAVFRKRGITTVGIYLGTTSERHSDQQSPKDAWDTRSTWPVGLSAIERTLTCAGNMTTAIRTRTRQYDQRFLYVVFTDSDVTKKRLQDLYGARMDLIFPPSRLAGSTYHGPMHRLEQTEDEALTLFESHLLSETDYQIITPSAFSKLALFRRGTSGRKTAVLMPNLENIEGTRGNERDPPLSIPDCSRLEGAFVTWEVLASFGNLG
ncbi:hypothetical protein BGW38_009020 [Lunasporangiospora selenospora]|uniref:Uncharacterized protein n=1 Tax=Lunasporangiospora selenospora TaxID=979761 RepID=A0A9P6FY22_9FUNG|nr:hypothetical protein BGW38_009020 [Lunasporangiospora selenospora]